MFYRITLFILAIIFTINTYSQNPKQDTIRVVMLYSDTALTDLYGVDEDGNDFTEIGFDEYCYWRHGYKVGDFYLDADKKRIPKTNVVWFYKPIK